MSPAPRSAGGLAHPTGTPRHSGDRAESEPGSPAPREAQAAPQRRTRGGGHTSRSAPRRLQESDHAVHRSRRGRAPLDGCTLRVRAPPRWPAPGRDSTRRTPPRRPSGARSLGHASRIDRGLRVQPPREARRRGRSAGAARGRRGWRGLPCLTRTRAAPGGCKPTPKIVGALQRARERLLLRPCGGSVTNRGAPAA